MHVNGFLGIDDNFDLCPIIGSSPSVVDAVVMASASKRKDDVLTSDLSDLKRLRGSDDALRDVGITDVRQLSSRKGASRK